MLVLLILSAVVTSVSANPSGSVTCTDTEYTPVITYTSNAGVITDLKLYIGADENNGGDAACTKTAANVAASTVQTFTYTAFTMASQTCDGVVLTADATTIKFEANATLEVTETFRSKIKRETKYILNIECSLTRNVTGIKADAGNVEKWTVDRASLIADTSKGPVTGAISFPIDIKFYTDDSYLTEVTAVGAIPKTFTPIMGSMLYIQLEEQTVTSVFKFITNKCYFNYGTTNNGIDGNEDVFFDKGCMVDTVSANNNYTEVNVDGSDSKFKMTVKSFFFTGQENTAVHLWCEVFVCLQGNNAGDCVQKTRSTCGMTKRRRRDTNSVAVTSNKDAEGGPIQTKIVESNQIILLDKTDIFVPSCGEGFVYDRVSKGCSNKNLMDIIGVHLDIPWNNEYSNKSSRSYKNLAVEKAYQLYAMLQMSEAKDHVVGLEVIDARMGSVVLTVRVKYPTTSNADEVFDGFSRAIESADQSRVSKILNIRKDADIEFIDVKPESVQDLNLRLVIIIAIVVLCIVIFVSIIAVWKVRAARDAGNPKVQVISSAL